MKIKVYLGDGEYAEIEESHPAPVDTSKHGRGVSEDDVEKIIQFLGGTCNYSLDDACQIVLGIEQEELSKENHQQIDEQIFRCEGCDWWCFSSEEDQDNEDGGRYCEDCHDMH